MLTKPFNYIKPKKDFNMSKSKNEQRIEIEKALLNFKKPINILTKKDELDSLTNDYIDYTMRCGECSIIPGYNK